MNYKMAKSFTLSDLETQRNHFKALYENACVVLAEWAEEFIYWPDNKIVNHAKKGKFDCPHDLLSVGDNLRLEAKRPCVEECGVLDREQNRSAHCSDCWKVYLELTTDFGGKIVQKADSDTQELVSLGVDKS